MSIQVNSDQAQSGRKCLLHVWESQTHPQVPTESTWRFQIAWYWYQWELLKTSELWVNNQNSKFRDGNFYQGLWVPQTKSSDQVPPAAIQQQYIQQYHHPISTPNGPEMVQKHAETCRNVWDTPGDTHKQLQTFAPWTIIFNYNITVFNITIVPLNRGWCNFLCEHLNYPGTLLHWF